MRTRLSSIMGTNNCRFQNGKERTRKKSTAIPQEFPKSKAHACKVIGHNISALCPPVAAISKARLIDSWLLTSAAFSGGTSTPARPSARARQAIGSTPLTGHTAPFGRMNMMATTRAFSAKPSHRSRTSSASFCSIRPFATSWARSNARETSRSR